MLSHRGNVRTSKFLRKSKEKKRFFFSKIYEGHIRIWFRWKKFKIISCLCTFKMPNPRPSLSRKHGKMPIRVTALAFGLCVAHIPYSSLSSKISGNEGDSFCFAMVVPGPESGQEAWRLPCGRYRRRCRRWERTPSAPAYQCPPLCSAAGSRSAPVKRKNIQIYK